MAAVIRGCHAGWLCTTRRSRRELLARLSDRARQEGIHRFTALIAADNVAMAGLLRNMCASLVRRESNTLEYEISLVPAAEYAAEPGALVSR